YWFLTDERVEQIDATSTGARMPRANMNAVLDFEFLLPQISEQQRIVGILDAAFDGIATAKANAEQNLQNARALFESHLQSVFTQRGEGWEKKPLTAVCDAIFAGGDVPKGNSSKTETDKYRIPIFTNGEKNKGLYGYTNMARVTEPSITISARGTIGYSEIRKESYYPAIRLIVVIPKKEILDLSFLYYAIESTDIGHSGTSIPQLTVPMVSGFTIPVPPIAVQQTIVGQLDALREETQRLESLFQRKLAALDELKKSLLHQAFSGML
ncbi:MAG: restriction endonuclease subunit S, partial [Sideroxyarcus sp.]|nr:restriction endonuclease subunit S [Sideroxyarcus sp.]